MGCGGPLALSITSGQCPRSGSGSPLLSRVEQMTNRQRRAKEPRRPARSSARCPVPQRFPSDPRPAAMPEALARSIATTAADVLGARCARLGISVTDEAIGGHLWAERGFRDHHTLVALINHTRDIIDRRTADAIQRHRRPAPSRRPRTISPPGELQLAFDLPEPGRVATCRG